MIIEIYKNKQDTVSSVRLLEKHIENQEFRLFYGTRKYYYNIEKEKAYDICRKYWIGKLDIRQRVELTMQEKNKKITYQDFVNSKMSGNIF